MRVMTPGFENLRSVPPLSLSPGAAESRSARYFAGSVGLR